MLAWFKRQWRSRSRMGLLGCVMCAALLLVAMAEACLGIVFIGIGDDDDAAAKDTLARDMVAIFFTGGIGSLLVGAVIIMVRDSLRLNRLHAQRRAFVTDAAANMEDQKVDFDREIYVGAADPWDAVDHSPWSPARMPRTWCGKAQCDYAVHHYVWRIDDWKLVAHDLYEIEGEGCDHLGSFIIDGYANRMASTGHIRLAWVQIYVVGVTKGGRRVLGGDGTEGYSIEFRGAITEDRPTEIVGTWYIDAVDDENRKPGDLADGSFVLERH